MRPSTWLICLTLACVSPVVSAAILQQDMVESHLVADFHPNALSQPGADGFWAVGYSNLRSVLARYNADSSVRSLIYSYSRFSEKSQVISLADGGALSVDSGFTVVPDAYYYLRRFAADGSLQWTVPSGANVEVLVDGSGGIWDFPSGPTTPVVEQIGGNGAVGTPLTLAIDSPQCAAADPAQAAIYIAGAANRSSAANDFVGSIWKVDASGIVWTASVADAGSLIQDVTVAPDGSLWGFGSLGTQLYGMHVSSDGAVLWSGAFATSTHPTRLRIVARPDGGVATLHWDKQTFESGVPGATAELDAFSSAGARLWQLQTGFVSSAYPYEFERLRYSTLLAAPDGDVFAAMGWRDQQSNALVYGEQSLRVDASGNPRYPSTSDSWNSIYPAYEVHILDDDSSLSVVGGALVRRDVDGTPLATAPTQGLVTGSADFIATVHGPDGSAYLLMDNPDANAIQLIVHNADGSLRWHAQVDGSCTSPFRPSTLVPRQSDVCVAGTNGIKEIVRCFAQADGTPTVTRDLGQLATGLLANSRAGLGPANQLIVVYASHDGAHHAVVDSAGALTHDIALPTGTFDAAGFGADGLAWVTAGSQLWRVTLDGSVRGPTALDVDPFLITPTPDGGALLDTLGGSPSIEALDRTAKRRWLTPLPRDGFVVGLDPTAATGVAYVTMQNVPPNSALGVLADVTTLQLALADGSIGWSSTTPYIYGAPTQAAVDTANAQLVLLSDWAGARDHVQIVRLALADGTVQGRTFVPCHAVQCSLSDAMLANDGSLRLAHETFDDRAGFRYELTTLSNDVDTIFAEGFGD